jgi:putative flippase GtrA
MSRALDKRKKVRIKNASKKAIQFMSIGGITAAVNAALAIPTAAILPTISFGITASALAASTQYLIDARAE